MCDITRLRIAYNSYNSLIFRNQTEELFANYIKCSGISSSGNEKNSGSQCLEYLVCLYANPQATLPVSNQPIDKAEKDVISV